MANDSNVFDEKTRFKGLHHIIGNTPLLEIHYTYRGRPGVVFAKAEYVNMTGSIKDRMAFHVLRKAYDAGLVREGFTIVEATSGNTGISLSAIGRALGHPVLIFMPDWMSRERVDLIRSMGARIVQVSKEEGGFLGSISRSEEFAQTRDDVFLPCQFSNPANIEAHEETTGPEIWSQLSFMNLQPDAFVAGVGTGGTIMGVGRYMKRLKKEVSIHPIEPLESPTLSTGHKIGKHRIQGISDEFIPPIVDLKFLDRIIGVSDGDAILASQNMASQLGLAVGISSGGNFIGAVMAREKLGPASVVVTVLPDDNKKYLSTDLLKTEPPADHHFAPDIRFLGYKAHKRVCTTCCDLLECNQKLSGARTC